VLLRLGAVDRREAKQPEPVERGGERHETRSQDAREPDGIEPGRYVLNGPSLG